MSGMPSAGLIHLGMDTSMNTIVVGVLRPGEEMPVVDRVFHDEESIRRLIGAVLAVEAHTDTRFKDPLWQSVRDGVVTWEKPLPPVLTP